MPLSKQYHRPLQNMTFEELKMWLEKNWPWRATTGGKALTADEIAAGTITTTELAFTPADSTNIIATINASTEGIQIKASKISISGETTFASGYDPSDKIDIGGAADDINSGTTTINGDKITTGTLTADKIAAGTITADKISTNTIEIDNMAFKPITPLAFGLPYLFGSGADGDAVLSTDTSWPTFTIKEYDNLTINSGVTLTCSDSTNATLVICATGTLTVSGTITVAGKGLNRGAGGATAGGLPGVTNTNSFGGAGGGGGGGAPTGYAGGDGGSTRVQGGEGADNPGQNGGNGNGITLKLKSELRTLFERRNYLLESWGGGGGGGGYHSTVPEAGGDGGRGGGVIVILADSLVVNSGGVISANGADGTSTTNSGGGGGGGGGVVYVVCRNYTNNGSITASKGAGGVSTNGGDGGNGGDGSVIIERIPW